MPTFQRGLYFEEFEIGKTITTAARTISEADIVTFAGVSGDFNQIHTDAEFAKATPYGVYDVSNDEGRGSVGDTSDTAEFAVESIRRWWNTLGKTRFPLATKLLVTAHAGGSNGYRLRAAIRYGVLDLSGPYRKAFEDSLDHVTQIADPFHLVKLANTKLDECRRRVQNETVGHRGRKDDPLYRARRLLTKAHERLDDRGEATLLGLLRAGDLRGEVRMAWHAKKSSAPSTRSTNPTRPPSSSPNSQKTSKTNHVPPKSTPSAAPSDGSSTTSSPGIRHGCRTGPSRRSTS